MSSNPDPFAWLRSAAGIVRQTDKSSGFYPLIVIFLLCLAAATPLLIWNGGNRLLQIFGVCLIALPLLCFIVVFTIKAFTDPNFCRSERHIERMAKIETMGTEKTQIQIREIKAEKLERPTSGPEKSTN